MSLAIMFLIMLVLLVAGAPVQFSFGGAILYMVAAYGFEPSALFATCYTRLSSVTLLAIPLFIMAGGIMEKGNIGEALVNWVNCLVGRVKGGLTCVATVASAVFGSICGSGAATLSCIGSIMAPQMKARKYPVGVSAAVVCCAAPLGLLIPPSAMQILVAWTLNISVLACFLSTVVPGIILTILICLCAVYMLRNNKELVMEEKRTPAQWGANFGAKTKTAVPALLMPFIILGGIYSGVMTATESAAIAVIYAIPVGLFIYRKLTVGDLGRTMLNTATTTGVVMVMIGVVMMLSRILTQEGVPQLVMKLLLGISDNKIVLLLMVNVFMILLGMIMDDTSATLLAAPILYPIMVELGVSPYQFAAIMGVNIGMGNITPPSAPFLYLSARIFGVEVSKVLKPTMIILLFAYMPTLLLTTFVPEASLWLPRLLLGAKLNI